MCRKTTARPATIDLLNRTEVVEELVKPFNRLHREGEIPGELNACTTVVFNKGKNPIYVGNYEVLLGMMLFEKMGKLIVVGSRRFRVLVEQGEQRIQFLFYDK